MENFLPGREAPVIYESSLSSTNTVLKELAQKGAAHGTVLMAGRQTGGRGRLGRSFESPPNGLYLSVLWRPELPPERLTSITPLGAVAACRAIRACTKAIPLIKWPNDLVLNGKKLCGILTEMSLDEKGGIRLVLGVGINLNAGYEELSPRLNATACSVFTETGEKTDREALAKSLITELDGLYLQWLQDEHAFFEEYRALCATCGREVLILQGDSSRRARALAVNADYSLKVQYPDGACGDIRFGEVSVRGLEGYA